ncbi:hypothetical protein ACWOFR_03115 [Carnobacterium gallinarum]|uniref:hypothetical protein n=1 Tax=Carnobacterium gallinarum TaxID=2749 RepID=UPI000557DF47|nr:hypothetical protein [Carnobacterium gallinarum]
MTSKVISKILNEATERNHIQQTHLARETHRAKSTINGYFNNVPTPIEAMTELANVIHDSQLSQELAHEVFGSIPSMKPTIYQDNEFSLDVLQKKESNERKFLKEEVLLLLAKQNNWLADSDKVFLQKYVNEFLDEVLVEIKLITKIALRADVELLDLISKRKPYWQQIGYLEKR